MSELREITYLSRLDNSMQPALICPGKGEDARPLAVCLHTWSYGLEGNHDDFVERCKALNWHFIFPLFRGPNWLPEACGSDLVVSDLECAVEYMKENYAVDNSRVYLVGDPAADMPLCLWQADGHSSGRLYLLGVQSVISQSGTSRHMPRIRANMMNTS